MRAIRLYVCVGGGGDGGDVSVCVCVCVCVCMCARACVRACVRAGVSLSARVLFQCVSLYMTKHE